MRSRIVSGAFNPKHLPWKLVSSLSTHCGPVNKQGKGSKERFFADGISSAHFTVLGTVYYTE